MVQNNPTEEIELRYNAVALVIAVVAVADADKANSHSADTFAIEQNSENLVPSLEATIFFVAAST